MAGLGAGIGTRIGTGLGARIGTWYEGHIFPLLLRMADGAVTTERQTLLAQCNGLVLEVGIGTGLSAPFYPESVTQVVGIEPNEALLEDCEINITNAQLEHLELPAFKIQAGDAQNLKFEDNSFDTAVAFLVFCTIPDPKKAAMELFRVLKPGGQLLFFEHVVAEKASTARWQARLNPYWSKVACGCHLDRDTTRVFEEAGFEFDEFRKYHLPRAPGIVSTVIQGRGIKR